MNSPFKYREEQYIFQKTASEAKKMEQWVNKSLATKEWRLNSHHQNSYKAEYAS